MYDLSPVSTQNKLMLVPMGEYGLGVFAREDIEAGEILFYAGMVEDENKSPNDYSTKPNFETPYVINAKTHGNLARFVQHAPALGQFEYEFDKNIKEQIFTANITFEFDLDPISHLPIAIYRVREKIKKGAMVAADYSMAYWEKNSRSPVLFNHSGELYNGNSLMQPSMEGMKKLGEYISYISTCLALLNKTKQDAPQYQELREMLPKFDINVLIAFQRIILKQFTNRFLGLSGEAYYNEYSKVLVESNNSYRYIYELQLLKFSYLIKEQLSTMPRLFAEKIDEMTHEQKSLLEIFSNLLHQWKYLPDLLLSLITLKHTNLSGLSRVVNDSMAKFYDERFALIHLFKQYLSGEQFEKYTSLPDSYEIRDWIWYADSPSDTPRQVKKSEIARQRGFKWSNEFVFPEGTDEAIKQRYYQGLSDFLFARYGDVNLNERLDKLLLCNMGDAGLGVFARDDIEPGLLCIYVGEFTLEHDDVEYGFSKFENVTHSINARHTGNISRFVQHAPSLGNFELEFSSDSEDAISLANVDHEMIIITGTNFMVVMYETLEPIKKGSMVAKDYGLTYWNQLKKLPIYFNKEGLPYNADVLCRPSHVDICKFGNTLILFEMSSHHYFSSTIKTPSFEALRDMIRGMDIALIKAFVSQMFEVDVLKRLQTVWNDEEKFKDFTAIYLSKYNLEKEGAYFLQMVRWFCEITDLLASKNATFFKSLDGLSNMQKEFVDSFKNKLRKDFRLWSIAINYVVQRFTFYIGNTSYQKPEFEKYFKPTTALYYLLKETVPAEGIEQVMHIGQLHKPLPQQMLSPVQSINYKELRAELQRLTEVKWTAYKKGRQIWVKLESKSVAHQVREKLDRFEIQIKKADDLCIVLDAAQLKLERLKAIEDSVFKNDLNLNS